MTLKEFFVQEIGIPEGCWSDAKQELREISENAAYQNLKSAYGYKGYQRYSSHIDDRLIEGPKRKDDYLGFLSKEVLKSELGEKNMILEKLTALAFDSPQAYDYPVMDVLDYLIREGRDVGKEHPEWFGWEDTVSSRDSFERIFEWAMESEFDISKKTSVFTCMVMSLKGRRMTELSKELTTLFFESDEIPRQIKKLIGRMIIEEEFLDKVIIGANKEEILASLEESSPDKFPEGYMEELRRQLDSSFAVEVGGHLRGKDFRSYMNFTVERRIVTRWLLDFMGSDEAEAFIGEWLGKEYDYRDFPVVEGITEFLKKGGGTDDEFTKEAIDTLRNANRCEVRKWAFEAGYELFHDEKYLEEAKNDDAEMVRKWAQGMEE